MATCSSTWDPAPTAACPTRPWSACTSWASGCGVTTQRGNTLYVHILDLQDDAIYLPLCSKRVKQVRMFSDKSKLRYTATGDGITIQLPSVPHEVDAIVEITLK